MEGSTGVFEMKLAVLSGKGGTGKTFLAANLAAVSEEGVYVDCDTEAPNGRLLFRPEFMERTAVKAKIPAVDASRCDGCQICTNFCRFHALAYVKNRLMLFPEICHSCGGCVLFCPQHALQETEKTIGWVEAGRSGSHEVLSGILQEGEVSGVPIIKALQQRVRDRQEIIVLDCPPGSSCSVRESIKTADYCVLAAEPTSFGTHNLQMVHELLVLEGKPHGVVLNKCIEGAENPAEQFCEAAGIPVLGKIPFRQDFNGIQSEGRLVVRESLPGQQIFSALLQAISQEAGRR